MFRNRKLFERSIKFMMLEFGLNVSDTRIEKLLYIYTKAWPEISMTNKFQCFVLIKMTS